MGKFLFKMERKYGQYAIRNLSLILICCYGIGYILQILESGMDRDILSYLSLNPYLILHGQVWRLISWILVPPGGFDILTLIMLYFYYSIGRSLESTWGDFRYNFYIFSGLLFTLIATFILYGVAFIVFREELANGTYTAEMLFTNSAVANSQTGFTILPGYWFTGVSTYYVSMSIFLAYAITFPEMRVMMFFLIPIRVKILGIIYALLIATDIFRYLIAGQYYMAFIIVASILNAVIFFLSTRQYSRMAPSELKRRMEYKRKVRSGSKSVGHETMRNGKTVITRHKCAICGRTELDGDDLEFRFCSKCDGNYEYCKDHLYSHEHVKRI